MGEQEVSAAIRDLIQVCGSTKRVKLVQLEGAFSALDISASKLIRCVSSFVRAQLLKLPDDPLEGSLLALGAAQCILACSQNVKNFIRDRDERRELNNAALLELKKRMATMTPEQVQAVKARSNGVNLGMMRRALKWKKKEQERLEKEAKSLALVRATNPTEGLNMLERVAHIINSKPTDKEMTVREIAHIIIRSNQCHSNDFPKICERVRAVVKKWKGTVFSPGVRRFSYRLRLPVEIVFVIRYRGMSRELLASMGE